MNPSVLTCTICGTPLAEAEFGATVTCPACGQTAAVYRFPAFSRRSAAGAPASAAGQGEAACYHHADKRAEAVCDACGRFLCGLCSIPFNDRTLCPACLALTQTAEADTHIPRRLRYDKLAMLCVLVSPFVYCISFINACFTLYLCVRHWRTPISVLPRSRWRLPVAGLLALGLLALWVAAGAAVAGRIYQAREKAASGHAEPRQTRSTHVR